MMTRIHGPVYGEGLTATDQDVRVKKKCIESNWNGLTMDMDQTSIPCIQIWNDFAVGMICTSDEDDIYLFGRHPWHNTLSTPVLSTCLQSKPRIKHFFFSGF